VSYKVVFGRIFAARLFAMGKERFSSGAAGRRHAFEFTTPFLPLRTVIPSEARDPGVRVQRQYGWHGQEPRSLASLGMTNFFLAG